MKNVRQHGRGGLGSVLGLAVTLVGCAFFALGGYQGLDQIGFDWHVRNFSTIQPDPRIVMVDIDDTALREIGDWPWPRSRYAQIINLLDELGANAIALDLVLSEPNDSPDADLAYGLHDALSIPGSNMGGTITDDQQLAAAIAKAGNVYLGMFFDSLPPSIDRAAMQDRALSIIDDDPNIDADAFARQLMATFPALGDPAHRQLLDVDYFQTVRMTRIFVRDFSLDAGEAAQRLSLDSTVARNYVPRAKRLAAQRLVRAFSADQPAASFDDFFRYSLPDAPPRRISPDRSDLLDAFRHERSFRAIAETNPPTPDDLRDRIVHAGDMTLPVDRFSVAAKGSGFVSFPREGSGGVVRDIPLIADGDGVLQMQLGLVVAIDHLGNDRAAISFEQGHIIIGTGTDRRALPLSRDGMTPINWHVPRTSHRWVDSFVHIPALRLLEVASNREAIAHNNTQIRSEWAELVRLRHADTPADYAAYVEQINRRKSSEADRTKNDGALPTGSAADELAELSDRIRKAEAESLAWLRRAHSLWQGETPENEEEKAQQARILDLYANLVDGRLAEEVKRLNAKLETRNAVILAELAPRLAGKICLVGYTASGVADLVASPVFDSMPGVMAHANVINMILSNEMLHRAPTSLNLALMLTAGVLVTLFTATRGTKTGVLALATSQAILVVAGAMCLRGSAYHLATLPAAANTLIAWAFVAVYRQLTEERTRRRFQQALAQYTSPAVAARMAEQHHATDLAPCPTVVTCYFSDLDGFTTLSERLGAERTRQVLNPYLQAMSRVLVDHDALINKFVGDGIFAFFNAPVLPCGQHAEAACRAALVCQRRLAELNARLDGVLTSATLSQRIGLSTGEVFVGDYGSDTKLDYTCIGDTVNVGARLETANKALGTHILVDGMTREAVGDRFSFRRIGRVRVPGKTNAIDVFELLGEGTLLDAATRDFVTRFEAAVEHFQHCEWDSCLQALESSRALRPDDRAIDRYAQAVARQQREVAADEFDAAISLVDD